MCCTYGLGVPAGLASSCWETPRPSQYRVRKHGRKGVDNSHQKAHNTHEVQVAYSVIGYARIVNLDAAISGNRGKMSKDFEDL